MLEQRINLDWDENFLSRSPMFAHLRDTGNILKNRNWPSVEDFNKLLSSLDAPPRSRNGTLLHCIPPVTKTSEFTQRYEPAIYLRGELQTRPNNWHDLFNLLVWSIFPQTKAVINERHFIAQRNAPATANRSAEQDAMTLFDESGVVVACAMAELGAMLKNFEWKQLFWYRRMDVIANMRFYVFGHGLLEKALRPYRGMTGKVIIVPVDPEFLTASLPAQIQFIDLKLALFFLTGAKQFSSTDLSPLPLLGVPGWIQANESETYYDDTRYFRPLKKDG